MGLTLPQVFVDQARRKYKTVGGREEFETTYYTANSEWFPCFIAPVETRESFETETYDVDGERTLIARLTDNTGNPVTINESDTIEVRQLTNGLLVDIGEFEVVSTMIPRKPQNGETLLHVLRVRKREQH